MGKTARASLAAALAGSQHFLFLSPDVAETDYYRKRRSYGAKSVLMYLPSLPSQTARFGRRAQDAGGATSSRRPQKKRYECVAHKALTNTGGLGIWAHIPLRLLL